jgi:hypothetical protein
MDISVKGLRDRRIAAADVFRTRDRRNVYAAGSRARRLAGRARADVRDAEFDRDPQDIRAVLLHCTSFTSSEALPGTADDVVVAGSHRMDFVIAHFVIRPSGEILYLRDVQRRLNSVSGRLGIDIEFEGSFSHGATPAGTRLSTAAIDAGRRLVWALYKQIPSIGYIHPHGQVQSTAGNPKRDSCPGPDVWMNVGEWAARTLHLSTDTTLFRNNHGISPAQRNPAYDQHVA